jgi:hypothetical protein
MISATGTADSLTERTQARTSSGLLRVGMQTETFMTGDFD